MQCIDPKTIHIYIISLQKNISDYLAAVVLKLWYTQYWWYLGSLQWYTGKSLISFLRFNNIPLWSYAKMTREVLLGAGVYQKIFPQARVLYEEQPFLIASGHGCYRALVGSFFLDLKTARRQTTLCNGAKMLMVNKKSPFPQCCDPSHYP